MHRVLDFFLFKSCVKELQASALNISSFQDLKILATCHLVSCYAILHRGAVKELLSLSALSFFLMKHRMQWKRLKRMKAQRACEAYERTHIIISMMSTRGCCVVA